jgi:hypothetical protein
MLIFLWISIPIVMDFPVIGIRAREVKSMSHQSVRDSPTRHAVNFPLIIVKERIP